MTPAERADANGHGPYCENCGDCRVCCGDEPCFAGGTEQDGGHVWPEDDEGDNDPK